MDQPAGHCRSPRRVCQHQRHAAGLCPASRLRPAGPVHAHELAWSAGLGIGAVAPLAAHPGGRRTGPFTAQVAVAMRRLGWLIIVGTAAAAAVQRLALDQLLNTMLVAQDHLGGVVAEPIRALLPVPVLAGAALLTFARIISPGTDIDARIQAPV